MKCDACGNEEDFVIYKKARRTWINCECGYEWEQGTSKTESACPYCGNYQQPIAARDFLRGDKQCWFCFHKHGETHAKFLARKKRGH